MTCTMYSVHLIFICDLFCVIYRNMNNLELKFTYGSDFHNIWYIDMIWKYNFKKVIFFLKIAKFRHFWVICMPDFDFRKIFMI